MTDEILRINANNNEITKQYMIFKGSDILGRIGRLEAEVFNNNKENNTEQGGNTDTHKEMDKKLILT